MTTARAIGSLDALSSWVGQEIACSDWVAIDQARIDRFAEVTGDRQWIHVDPARAARESPFKSTVAHGYLTLSLLPMMFATCLRIDGVGMAVNYGLDRVRFPAPVLSGQRVRARFTLAHVVPIEGGVHVSWSAVVEIENGAKPACVAQMLTRYYAAPGDAASRDRAGRNFYPQGCIAPTPKLP